MKQVYKSGAVAAAPSADDAQSVGNPTGGDVAAGMQATVPGPYAWFQLYSELEALIVAAGLVPDKAVLTQVRDAVIKVARSATERELIALPGDGLAITDGDPETVVATGDLSGIAEISAYFTYSNGPFGASMRTSLLGADISSSWRIDGHSDFNAAQVYVWKSADKLHMRRTPGAAVRLRELVGRPA